ncbi:MAG: efflux RND transporter permease subunit [bacterium]|nr:efflux RND transporter permease subunit [bacterium]
MKPEQKPNMEKKKTLLGRLLEYRQVLALLTVLAIASGIVALFVMPRDEYPQITIPNGLIVGVYPGATSREVEEQLTSKVENRLFEYKAVDRSKTYSVSKENLMLIYVEVDEHEKNKEEFWLRLRHDLNDLRDELPSGVLSLTADNDFGNTSALLFAVQSDTKSYKELENTITLFENDVRRVKSVSRVKHYGLQKEQISVTLDGAKLAATGVKPVQIAVALKPQNAVNFAGELDDGRLVRPVHIPSRVRTEEDVASQIVYSDPLGRVVRVRDVAKVTREYGVLDSYIRVNGRKCLLVSCEMKVGENIVRFGREVGAAVSKFSASLPPDVRIVTISDIPGVVSKSIANFLKEFFIAMASVIVVTLLLLPMRVARIAAMAIPTSILTAIGMMWARGMDLQTVSLAGLIIVLGITVDDAIVIVDNYIEKLDQGMPPFDAATRSVTELFSSVLSATLIIIACFLPIPFFMKGTGGDFVRSLPATITYALLISLLVSVTVIPLMSYRFIRTGLKHGAAKRGRRTFLEVLQKFYDGLLEKAFTMKKTVVFTGAAAFLSGIVILAVSPRESFPSIERNQFAVEVYLPSGSSLAQTDSVMTDLSRILEKDPRVTDVASFVGTNSPRFHTLYAPNFPAKNYGQMIVLTRSNRATTAVLDEYSRSLKGRYPSADIKWKQISFAYYKAPIEIRVSGDDPRALRRAADSIAAVLRSDPSAEFIRTDWEQPLQTAELAVRRDEAARLGYSNSLIAYSLMLGTQGLPVATVWEGDYPVDVRLMVDKKVKSGAADLLNQNVTSPLLFSSVPVRQLAELRPGWTEGQIVRRNGIRTVTVMAEIERGTYPATVLKRIKPAIDGMRLPPGVSVEYGGDYRMTQEHITPFYYSLALSIVLIFIILMFQYRNVKSALLIMVTMPLSVFGAAFGVCVAGYPFSVTAFIGLTGLMGIVVRNGVIFVTYAEELRHRHGFTLEGAAIAAGKRRMRPIFLTSTAAAVGVIPMILSRSPLWGPLGSVICFGLLFGLALSLLVLPVLYYYFHLRDFTKTDEVL